MNKKELERELHEARTLMFKVVVGEKSIIDLKKYLTKEEDLTKDKK